MKLTKVIRRLYASEINCGLQTFWDGGLEAWIGDEMNGRRASETFGLGDLGEVATWLHDEALRLYPQSRYARRRSSLRHAVGFAPTGRAR